jgi:hypothetical protein
VTYRCRIAWFGIIMSATGVGLVADTGAALPERTPRIISASMFWYYHRYNK